MITIKEKLLFDKRSVIQVLGCLMKQPGLMEDYKIEDTDFEVEVFHKLVFSCIHNLYYQGLQNIDCFAIDSYLSNYDKQYTIFNDNNGLEYCEDAIQLADLNNFDYYYQRLRKFSYLRFIESQGYDTRILYDTTVTEETEQEKQAEKLDSLTINDMIEYLDEIITVESRMRYGSNTCSRGQLAGKGMKELKERLKEEPEWGLPLRSPMLSTIVRGARLGKLYMRSASTGGGKTRTAMADICGFSIPWFYDTENEKWVHTGFSEPSLFISTELEEDELQTLILAYVSGVNEDKIVSGDYTKEEEKRVDQAIEYIESSPLYIEFIPDFSISDIVNLVKKYKREKGCLYFVFDYIHTSAKMIGEISMASRGMKLREDQILFLAIDSLKNLCNTLKVFMLTMSQLNGSYKESSIKDETLLRGWLYSLQYLICLSAGSNKVQNNIC